MKFRVTSLDGNVTGNNFRYGGLKVGDLVTEEEVRKYYSRCGKKNAK